MGGINKAEIGARIKRLRGDMTQKAFADQLGVGRTSVVRYEAGDRTPDAEFIAKAHAVLGVDPVWLLTGVGQASPISTLKPDEAALLDNYRNTPEDKRAAIRRLALRSRNKAAGARPVEDMTKPLRSSALQPTDAPLTVTLVKIGTEDRRLRILRALLESTGYTANSRLLREVLEVVGHAVSGARLHGDLVWLAEAGLVSLRAAGDLLVIRLLDFRADVASGRCQFPGVLRPDPGE